MRQRPPFRVPPMNDDQLDFKTDAWWAEQEKIHRNSCSLAAVHTFPLVSDMLSAADYRVWRRFMWIIFAYIFACIEQTRPRRQEIDTLKRCVGLMRNALKRAVRSEQATYDKMKAAKSVFDELWSERYGHVVLMAAHAHLVITVDKEIRDILPRIDPLVDPEQLSRIVDSLELTTTRLQSRLGGKGARPKLRRQWLMFMLAAFWRRHGKTPLFEVTTKGLLFSCDFNKFVNTIGKQLLREEFLSHSRPNNSWPPGVGFELTTKGLSDALALLKLKKSEPDYFFGWSSRNAPDIARAELSTPKRGTKCLTAKTFGCRST